MYSKWKKAKTLTLAMIREKKGDTNEEQSPVTRRSKSKGLQGAQFQSPNEQVS